MTQEFERESTGYSLRKIAPPSFYYDEGKNRREVNPQILMELDLGEGFTALGPPPEIPEILEELFSSGALLKSTEKYGAVDDSESINYIRERHGVKKAVIYMSGGGSDEIDERVITQVMRAPFRGASRIFATGPTYPHIDNFAKRFGQQRGVNRMQYNPIILPLGRTHAETVLEMIRARLRDTRRTPGLVYVCNPSTPTGEVVDLKLLEELAKVTSQRRELLLIDEAFGDFLPDNQSAISLTEKYDDTIVVRSLSKGIGLPGLRVGYVVMSPSLGKVYKDAKRVVDISGPQLLIANKILNPKIILPHLEHVRDETARIKKDFLMELSTGGVVVEHKDELAYEAEFPVRLDDKDIAERFEPGKSIEVLPTHPSVPIMTIDGESEQFCDKLEALNIRVARGSAFKPTHPEMSDRYARITLPDEGHIPELIKRLRISFKMYHEAA